jgi:hypothetical protein
MGRCDTCSRYTSPRVAGIPRAHASFGPGREEETVSILVLHGRELSAMTRIDEDPLGLSVSGRGDETPERDD